MINTFYISNLDYLIKQNSQFKKKLPIYYIYSICKAKSAPGGVEFWTSVRFQMSKNLFIFGEKCQKKKMSDIKRKKKT